MMATTYRPEPAENTTEIKQIMTHTHTQTTTRLHHFMTVQGIANRGVKITRIWRYAA